MTDLVSLTARKVQDVVEEKGSVSLSHLETLVVCHSSVIINRYISIDKSGEK